MLGANMNMSEKYYRNLDKLAARHRSSGLDITVEIVHEAFGAAMGKVPDDLKESIFLHFLDGFNKSGKPEAEFIANAYRLGPYVDLFWMEYDEKQDPLPEEDWPALTETVNDSAGELDLKILTYVMGKIVEAGKL